MYKSNKDRTLRNPRAFIRSYLDSKTGVWVLGCTYGRNPKHVPKVMAHAFKASVQ